MYRQREFAEDALGQAGLTIKDGLAVEKEFDEDGLEDLAGIEDVEEEKPKMKPMTSALIKLSLIIPNPNQPRQVFNEEELKEMAKTIRARGRVIHSVIVTPRGDKFMLISGERRWRASIIAEVEYIPAEIDLNPGNELDIFQAAVIANYHQTKMSLAEEAYAMKRLMTERGWNQSQLARQMGKKPADISNLFKVFNLHEEFQTELLFGKVRPGPILQLAIYEIEAQMPLWEDLNKEVAAKFSGKMPHHNVVAKILRRLAEARGIVPRKTKRGRQAGSHAEMVIRSLRKAMEKFRKELKALNGLSDEALELVGDDEVFNVLTNLGQTAELIEDECHRLEARLHI